MAQIKKFKVGNQYSMRSACNHECVWTYKVLARTACTVTLAQVMSNGKTKTDIITCRINKGLSEFSGAESVKPLGSYSMCPILSADKLIG
jgi:hypothetical protein